MHHVDPGHDFDGEVPDSINLDVGDEILLDVVTPAIGLGDEEGVCVKVHVWDLRKECSGVIKYELFV